MTSFVRSPPHGLGASLPAASSSQDEEDLLAMLSGDTFSLESNRDRALVELSSFLKMSIPTGPHTELSSDIYGNSAYSFGSDFNSSAPSTGSSAAYSPPSHPQATPYGTPVTHSILLPALPAYADQPRPTSRAPQRSPYPASASFANFPSTSASHGSFTSYPQGFPSLDLGCPRAPAVSRERAASRARAGSLLAQPAQSIEDEDMMEEDEPMEDELAAQPTYAPHQHRYETRSSTATA